MRENPKSAIIVDMKVSRIPSGIEHLASSIEHQENDTTISGIAPKNNTE